jgi:D-sedoheptulose 7-phosphate isomerase
MHAAIVTDREGQMTSKITIQEFWASEISEHMDVTRATQTALQQPFEQLVAICSGALKTGNTLFFFGNGGSASDAQHLATELTVRYKTDRRALRAIALTTDTSALTAIGNDYGFEQLFARQLEALGRPGDIAIAITTSGRSPNIHHALETAKKLSIIPTALSGKGGGTLHGLASPLIVVPSQTTARIQEMHIMLGQMLCNAIEYELGLVKEP